MDQILAHLTKHAQIYGIVFVVLLIAIVFVMNTQIYEVYLIRKRIESMFVSKSEGFQNDEIVAGGILSSHPDACKVLKEHIENYEKVRAEHKDVPIQNLDETIAQFKEYFVSYNCE